MQERAGGARRPFLPSSLPPHSDLGGAGKGGPGPRETRSKTPGWGAGVPAPTRRPRQARASRPHHGPPPPGRDSGNGASVIRRPGPPRARKGGRGRPPGPAARAQGPARTKSPDGDWAVFIPQRRFGRPEPPPHTHTPRKDVARAEGGGWRGALLPRGPTPTGLVGEPLRNGSRADIRGRGGDPARDTLSSLSHSPRRPRSVPVRGGTPASAGRHVQAAQEASEGRSLILLQVQSPAIG